MKQTNFFLEFKGEVIVGDFDIPVSITDRSSRQKTNKETENLNITDQLDLTDRYRTLHLTEAENTFFSSTHITFPSIDHIGHETSLNKFKKIEIT